MTSAISHLANNAFQTLTDAACRVERFDRFGGGGVEVEAVVSGRVVVGGGSRELAEGRECILGEQLSESIQGSGRRGIRERWHRCGPRTSRVIGRLERGTDRDRALPANDPLFTFRLLRSETSNRSREREVAFCRSEAMVGSASGSGRGSTGSYGPLS